MHLVTSTFDKTRISFHASPTSTIDAKTIRMGNNAKGQQIKMILLFESIPKNVQSVWSQFFCFFARCLLWLVSKNASCPFSIVFSMFSAGVTYQ